MTVLQREIAWELDAGNSDRVDVLEFDSFQLEYYALHPSRNP